MIAEATTNCSIHGVQQARWCAECDKAAGIDRDPFSGTEVSPEQRNQMVKDSLAAAGLSPDQVALVMHSLNTGVPTGPAQVSDAQLKSVLSGLSGQRSLREGVAQEVIVAAPAQSETAAQAGEALRAAGWSEERIKEATGG